MELAAGAVAPVDHRVVEAVAVGVPPVTEDFSIHGQVIRDDVQVPGRGELIERFVDPSLAECWRCLSPSLCRRVDR